MTFREKGNPSFNGHALPIYSAHTEDDALLLIVGIGTRAYDDRDDLPEGMPWYFVAGFDGAADPIGAMTGVADKLDSIYERMGKRD